MEYINSTRLTKSFSLLRICVRSKDGGSLPISTITNTIFNSNFLEECLDCRYPSVPWTVEVQKCWKSWKCQEPSKMFIPIFYKPRDVIRKIRKDFSGGLVVKTPCFQCRETATFWAHVLWSSRVVWQGRSHVTQLRPNTAK